MKDLAVYVHIPFCVKKCNYCDFLSFNASRDIQNKYIDSLINEIKQAASDFEDFSIRSVFLGGGTPSLPDAVCISKIMEALGENYSFSGNPEISMEMNPGTVTREKLLTYKSAGINRISIGMQSSKDDELKALGRIHDNQKFLDCYNLVREAGFKNVNIDVLSALPGQSFDSYMDTLRQVVSLKPEHISAYSLIIEEGTPFFDLYGEDATASEGSGSLPSEDEERRMYHATKSFLKEYGYERYEISNYALKKDCDFSCIHNKAYWTGVDYIGFGLGASSMIENVRWSNISDLEEYTRLLAASDSFSCKKIRCEITPLDEKTQMEEFMFLGLRLTDGISIAGFADRFGKDIDSIYGAVIQKKISEGLLEKNSDRLRLTEYGMDVSNYVMSEFLLD